MKKRTIVGAILASVFIGAFGLAAPANAAGTVHGCPSGYFCIYPDSGWNGDKPSHKYFKYGSYNLSGQLGNHRVLNNQTDGAKVGFYTGYDGTGELRTVVFTFEWWWDTNVNLTPINSIKLVK
ncbi:hypothetical protein ACFRFH_13185 [Leifsonia sp. NPDC056824]|uniref:hypothetical protein n=1 Tax=Leifsonia sp. NPDC056824 TaxID=3345953 RepID=UPI00368DB178